MHRINDHGVLNPNCYIYNTILISEAQEKPRKKEMKSLRARGSGCLLPDGVSWENNRENEPLKSQQYSFLNKIVIMTIPLQALT